jgi:hypothetical protein
MFSNHFSTNFNFITLLSIEVKIVLINLIKEIRIIKDLNESIYTIKTP